MDNKISYLEYLAREVNNSDGINEAIDSITRASDRLREAQNAVPRKTEEIEEKEETLDEHADLVRDIRARMIRSMSNTQNEDVAERLAQALKERIAQGDSNISHAIIDNDGYEIYEDER